MVPQAGRLCAHPSLLLIPVLGNLPTADQGGGKYTNLVLAFLGAASLSFSFTITTGVVVVAFNAMHAAPRAGPIHLCSIGSRLQCCKHVVAFFLYGSCRERGEHGVDESV